MRNIKSIVVYLLIFLGIYFLIQATITSVSYYNRCNNWVVGHTGKLSHSENLDVNRAKAVAADYLRSIAQEDYQTAYALTINECRPSYPEFVKEQKKLRGAYKLQSHRALAEELELVMNVDFSVIKNAISNIQGAQLKSKDLNDCLWPERTLLLKEKQTGSFWIILGMKDHQWKLVSISQTDPRISRSMPVAAK